MQKQSVLTRFFSSGGNGLKLAIIESKDKPAGASTITPSDVMKKAIEAKKPDDDPPTKRKTEVKTEHISDEDSNDGLVTKGRSGKKRLKFLDDDDEENYLVPEEKRQAGESTAPKEKRSTRTKKTKDDSDFELEGMEDEDEDDLDDFIENDEDEDDEAYDDDGEDGKGRKGRGKNQKASVGSKSGNKTPAAKGTSNARKRKTPVSNNNSKNKSSKNAQKSLNFSACQEENVFFNTEQEQGKTINMNEFDDKTPDWATIEKRRDSSRRLPTDPNFDPTTLYVPPEEKKNLTPTMRQYWEIKSEHMDKVIFFKLGKFYELFYEDALVGNFSLKYIRELREKG